MSGVNSAPPSTTLTIEALLELMNFVKRPDYEDKLRDLVAAKIAHDASAAAAKTALDTATAAQKKLEGDAAEYRRIWAEMDANQTDKHSELLRKEAAVAVRDAALKQREADHAVNLERAGKDITDRSAKLASKETELVSREAAVKQREDAADKRKADLDRRLAKMREAAL